MSLYETRPSNLRTLEPRLEALRAQFIERNPLSKEAAERARLCLPGGTTRSVLHAEPFPIAIKSARGAVLISIDGHEYIDFVSDFTAGLFGHSNDAIRDAVVGAASSGFSLGAVTELESRLSQSICRRFPSVDLVRFCNSGTEANTYALAAALAYTRRNKILVFDNGYHGGTLNFSSRHNPLNLPHRFVFGTFNDCGKTALEADNGIGAILVEPLQSAGGMHPATKEFLEFLRMLANSLGAVLIFDEVVTSRLAFHGLQGYHGVKPDMTTLGKYLGGGLPFGAFGGKREIMEQFDPRAQAKETLHHSGTFNNNVFTMSAAVAVAGLVTEEEINRINVLGDRARQGINELVEGTGLSGKLVATGMGSCIGIHFYGEEADVLRHLFYYHHLQRGLWIGKRGFLALNFAHDDEDIEAILSAVKGFVDEYI